MKRFTIVFVCLLTVSLSSLAQTAETFDLATFQAPVGWKRQDKDGVLIFNTPTAALLSTTHGSIARHATNALSNSRTNPNFSSEVKYENKKS